MSNNPLKPCPFCGGEAGVKHESSGVTSFQIVGCLKVSMLCPNPSMTVYRDDIGDFDYTYWNRRAENKQ